MRRRPSCPRARCHVSCSLSKRCSLCGARVSSRAPQFFNQIPFPPVLTVPFLCRSTCGDVVSMSHPVLVEHGPSSLFCLLRCSTGKSLGELNLQIPFSFRQPARSEKGSWEGNGSGLVFFNPPPVRRVKPPPTLCFLLSPIFSRWLACPALA